jgi:hypothetical protein
MVYSRTNDTVIPTSVCFPLINKQGSLISKVIICLCLFMLSRANHEDNTSGVKFLTEHGIPIQHVFCVPFYFAIICWLSVVLPSCFFFYTQVKVLHQYVANMLVVFLSYYCIILVCMIYRPQMTAPLALVVSVHIIEKCMLNTGEHILYGGRNMPQLFQTIAIALIGFSWIYLPIHTSSSVDFITCLFAAELLGIAIVFTYFVTTGVGVVVFNAYNAE